MKKLFKIAGIFFGVVVVLLIAGYLYLTMKYPNVGPAPEMKINGTPEMIARGKYLANSFAGCMDCHSKRDFSKFAGPMVPGTEGKGGEDFGEGAGVVYARNITSDKETGVGNWTDGELFRAITMGVDKNGEALGPMMPYPFFRNMDEQDVKSVIAYIRTLPPVKNEVPKHNFSFPFSLIVRTIPSAPDFMKRPDASDKIALGQYYSVGCKFCHSPSDKGEFLKEKLFSGGVEYPGPKGGVIRSANITPDKETGIGNLTKEQFIQKFKAYLNPESYSAEVKDGEFNSIMPWTFFATATEEDLGCIYDYLMTVPPVKNKVEKFTPGPVNAPQ